MDPDYDSEEEIYDEVDGAPVFYVVVKEDIPDKFVLETNQMKRMKISNYLTIPQTWGDIISPGSEHTLGLLTLDKNFLEPKEVKETIKKLGAKTHKLEVLRWKDNRILINFEDIEGYSNFGNRLLEGKLDPGEKRSITCLEPITMGALSRVSMTVTSNQSELLHHSLAEPVITFWATVAHLRIVSDKHATGPLPTSHLPHLCFTMLFEGKTQANAVASMDRLSKSPWKAVPISSEVGKVLDPGTYFYQNSLGGPLVGVKTGRPSSGIQLVVFVQKKENFAKMVEFYQGILGPDMKNHGKDSGNVLYWMFPISRRCEFMVAFFPGFDVATSPELELVVKTKEKDAGVWVRGGDATLPVDAGSWVKDPEGNSVMTVWS